MLTTAAQRVAQEAQSQVIASTVSNEHAPELQALAKQQHVLTVTAQAFDQEVSGQHFDIPQQTNVLAVAAQQVVLQAARQVAADRSAAVASQISAGLPPPPQAATQVTVNEVSMATQTAVAQAVEITGPLSSEVDVLITASSLLQQQTRAPVSPPVPTVPVDVVRLALTSIVSAASFSSSLTSSAVPVISFFFFLPRRSLYRTIEFRDTDTAIHVQWCHRLFFPFFFLFVTAWVSLPFFGGPSHKS